MRPLLPREKVLLWVIGLIVPVVAFYVLVYAPKSQVASQLEQSLAAQRAELAQLQAQAARRGGLQQQLAELQSTVQTLEAKLPSAREIPGLLVQLDALAGRAGVDLTLIKPGPLQPATLPQGAPSGPALPRVGGGVAAPKPAPAQAGKPSSPAGAEGFQQFTVELSTRGTFDQILQFVHGIETFPRFLAISDVRLTPAPSGKDQSPAKPELTLGMTTTAYVVPESGGSR